MSKSSVKDIPLYISIDLPDFRKRFIITYENVYSKSIPIKKELIRIKTKDGRRLTSLNSTYNNQLLDVTISTMSKGGDQDDDSPTYSLRHSSNHEPLPSQAKNNDPTYVSDSVFLAHCRELQATLGKSQVIVSESLPYCVHVHLGNNNALRSSSVSLYLLDHPEYKEVGLTSKSIILRANEDSLQDIVRVELVNHPSSDMITLVNSVVRVYNQYIQTQITTDPQLPKEVQEIFPLNFKELPTISPVSFYNQLNELIIQVSKDYQVPASVAMNFLFKYKFNIKGMRKSLTNIDSYGCANIEKHRFLNISGGECSICYCDIDEPIEFFCGHRFCRGCISEYLIASINDGNGIVSPIRCCATGCPVMIDQVTIASLIPDRNADHLKQMFINDAASLTRSKWCTSRGCKRLFYPKGLKDCIPYSPCHCKNIICIYCGKNELHWPSPCDHSFMQEDDFANYLWMAQNTTLCFNCKYPIQRNEGCNHMTCTKCRYEFCYEQETKKVDCKPEYSRVRSLRCLVHFNGTNNEIGTFFIPSQFSKLRESILTSLQKANQFEGVAQSQLVLYNQYGGQIKHSEEIMYNEVLYVARENEEFKEPPEVAPSSESPETIFNKKAALRKKEALLANNVDEKKLTEDQITDIANRLSEMLDLTIDECYEMVKKTGATSEVDAINSVLTYQIHNQNTTVDEENAQEILTYEQLVELFPSVAEDVIERALIESKNDLEKAADWLYDYEDKWMKNICSNQEDKSTSPKAKYNTDYFDDEDDDNEYEDDPDYIYANSRLSDTQAKLYD
ncbi:hypothetical protein PPL_02735 [Heterostelium album PN500]|uniref:RBR-type E3 ubiquitin transferase n=1 Tax=Heterostelium pallidum (strain ATCC 26659 / Pp 5 / PN500) TaxID=670386 RepID=D3B2X1_HETP5|nr:hypothetical protein PPL_02735 [Heterostelium album PN500]EFA83669.1 hypothetical protein PPL_02735 [Heterostelium album PN500]|eukprot:XP_020435786.1 hypothetical protein PPL_02735 [Heterostelium album PN500]